MYHVCTANIDRDGPTKKQGPLGIPITTAAPSTSFIPALTYANPFIDTTPAVLELGSWMFSPRPGSLSTRNFPLSGLSQKEVFPNGHCLEEK